MPFAALPLDALAGDEALQASVPVLVCLRAPWRAPCGAQMDQVRAFSSRVGPGLAVALVDLDAARGGEARHRLHGIPTLVLYRDGKEVARREGGRDLTGPGSPGARR